MEVNVTKAGGIFGLEIDVHDIVINEAREAGKELAEEIKKNAKDILKTGSVYADGWTSKNTPTGSIVYNAGRDASLGHLLENGHLAVDGSFVQPKPHIYPAREKVMNDLFKKVSDDL